MDKHCIERTRWQDDLDVLRALKSSSPSNDNKAMMTGGDDKGHVAQPAVEEIPLLLQKYPY